MDMQLANLMIETLRTLALICGPIVVGVAVIAGLSSVLQAATSLTDHSVAYVSRVFGLLVVIYLMLQFFLSSLLQFTMKVYG